MLPADSRQPLPRTRRADASSGQQATPAPYQASRIAKLLRRTGLGAVVRIAAHPRDGSQMIAAGERISVTLTWAVIVIATLGIVTAASLPAGAVIAIIGLELTGFTVGVLGTRWRRRGDRSDPPAPPVDGT